MTDDWTDKLHTLLSRGKAYYHNKLDEKFPDTSLIFKKQKPVVIFGAGRMGRTFNINLKKHGIKPAAFVDNNPDLWGTGVDGVGVISMRQLKKNYKHALVLVASLLYEDEIRAELEKERCAMVYPLAYLNLKFPDIFPSPEYEDTFEVLFVKENQRQIEKLMTTLADNQSQRTLYNLIKYRLTFNLSLIQQIKVHTSLFQEKILSITDHEVFLDGGAYIGDSLEAFLKATRKKYDTIYAFEPDRHNFTGLEDKIEQERLDDVVTQREGLWHETGHVSFDQRGTVDSRVELNNDGVHGKVAVVSIDDFVAQKKKPTLIKLDIEGAEPQALSGAGRLLQKGKPKLAISAYHSATDLWQIPLLIHHLNPNYKLYLRHFSTVIVDTMCLAV